MPARVPTPCHAPPRCLPRAGPIIDPGYADVAFLWFGFALLMWLALFVMMFQRTVGGCWLAG